MQDTPQPRMHVGTGSVFCHMICRMNLPCPRLQHMSRYYLRHDFPLAQQEKQTPTSTFSPLAKSQRCCRRRCPCWTHQAMRGKSTGRRQSRKIPPHVQDTCPSSQGVITIAFQRDTFANVAHRGSCTYDAVETVDVKIDDVVAGGQERHQ